MSTLGGFHVFTILFIQLPYKVSYLAMPISCCKTQYSYPPEAVPPQIILLTSEVGNKHLFVLSTMNKRVRAGHSEEELEQATLNKRVRAGHSKKELEQATLKKS